MTISSQTRKAGPFTGNDSSTAFPFAFKVFRAADLLVVRQTTSTGAESTLTLDTDYTVSLNANQNANPGGTVTLLSALATGKSLVITSSLEYLQQTELTNQGGFYPSVITNALDRLTIFAQQLVEGMGRTLKYPISDASANPTLPAKDQRKGRVLAFHETTGDPVQGPSIASVGAVASNAAAIDAVAAISDEVTTVADNIEDVRNYADTYLGGKSNAPTTRNDGSALQAGDMYFDTTLDSMQVWRGTAWAQTYATGSIARDLFTATAGQTVFSVPTYTPGANILSLFLNGVKLLLTTDYAETDANTVTLVSGATVGDSVEVVVAQPKAIGEADAALVNYDGGTVQDVLDSAKPMASYTALRAYTGRATTVRITDNGCTGFFWRDVSDTTTLDNGGTVIVDASGRRWKRIVTGEYLDSWWQPVLDGITDNALKYQAIAGVLPDGATLRIVGAGTRIVGSTVTFAQAGLNVVCDQGAKFKQKNNTLTLNHVLVFSGTLVTLVRPDVDGNVAGNPTAYYTGRGELVKMSGDLARVEQITVRNTHVAANSCGLFITGKDSVVDGVTGYGTGRVCIRDMGDRTTIRNVRALNIANSSGGIGNKVIAKDGGNESASTPFTWVTYENIYGHSSNNGFHELIVVDDSLNIGGLVRANNLVADYASSTGPDVIKFVNCRRVDIDGLTTYHAGDGVSNASLRFQENVSEVNLNGLDLAGHINFDTTTYVRCTVDGNSVIGRDLSGPVCIDDFPSGYLSVADGCALKNFTNSAVGTNSAFTDNVISIGECVINGSSTGSAANRVIIQPRAYSVAGQKRRTAAGQFSVRKPIELTYTRTLESSGRWIANNDAQDASCLQGNDGRFLVSNSSHATAGPNGVEGWKKGMELYRRDPVAGAAAYIFVCTTSGASCTDAWVGSTAYTVGQWRHNGGNVYACSQAGTSTVSGGPTGTGTGIVDGSCAWDYVGAKAVFKAVGSVAA